VAVKDMLLLNVLWQYQAFCIFAVLKKVKFRLAPQSDYPVGEAAA
jgi:hypothetical protein